MTDAGRRLYTETEHMDGSRAVFYLACEEDEEIVTLTVERITEQGECLGKARIELTGPECYFLAVLFDATRFVTNADSGAGGRVVCQLTAKTEADEGDARYYLVMESGNIGSAIIDVGKAETNSENFSNLVRALVTHEESVKLSGMLREIGAQATV